MLSCAAASDVQSALRGQVSAETHPHFIGQVRVADFCTDHRPEAVLSSMQCIFVQFRLLLMPGTLSVPADHICQLVDPVQSAGLCTQSSDCASDDSIRVFLNVCLCYAISYTHPVAVYLIVSLELSTVLRNGCCCPLQGNTLRCRKIRWILHLWWIVPSAWRTGLPTPPPHHQHLTPRHVASRAPLPPRVSTLLIAQQPT